MVKKSNIVLILAPHTDDGELGCGGTIDRFIKEGKEIYYVAFSTVFDAREENLPQMTLVDEVKQATNLLGIDIDHLILFNYKVRELSYHRQKILDDLIFMKRNINPEIVFLPCEDDLHQDHYTIYREGLRAFKEHTVLGYELPWNNIAFHARHFVALKEEHIQRKVNSLNCYSSQVDRNYMNRDFIFGLARTRGVQIGCNYAEAFDVVRWVIS